MVVVTPFFLDLTSVLMLGTEDGDDNTPAALQIKLKSPDCCGDDVGVSFFCSCTFLKCFSLSRCWFMLSGPVNCLLHTLHSKPPGALLMLAPVDGEILRVERLFSTSFNGGVTVNPSTDFLKDGYLLSD